MANTAKSTLTAILSVVETAVKQKTRNISWSFKREIDPLHGRLICDGVTSVNGMGYTVQVTTPYIHQVDDYDTDMLAEWITDLASRTLAETCFTTSNTMSEIMSEVNNS